MKRKEMFNLLKLNHPFITEFPHKLQQFIENQFPIDRGRFKAFKIRMDDKEACMLVVDTEIMVFWMSGFWLFKFPRIQIFDLNHLNRFKCINSDGLFIHASKDARIIDEDYQAGEYYFMSVQERNSVVQCDRK